MTNATQHPELARVHEGVRAADRLFLVRPESASSAELVGSHVYPFNAPLRMPFLSIGIIPQPPGADCIHLEDFGLQ